MNPSAREIVTSDGVVLRVGVVADGEVLTRVGTTAVGTAAGGGAPTTATYLTLSTNASLTSERVLTEGTGIDFTDGGAGGNLTITVDLSEISAGGDLTGTMNAPTIAAGAVTLAKLADLATDRLIGRDTAGTGVSEALTVSGGVEFSGSGGIRRSALSGDVTAAAGSGTVTVDKVAGTTPGATGLASLAAATEAAGRTAIGIATGTSTSHVLGWNGSSWAAVLIVLPATVYVSNYVQEWPAGWGTNAVDPTVAIDGVIS